MDASYTDSLSNFLRTQIFPLAKVSDQIAIKLLAPDQMQTWTVAFTHKSANPNPDQNYDQFEKLGDSVLKTAFLDFLLEKYVTINSKGLSELAAYYLSKPKLGELSNRLGLPKFMIGNLKKTLSDAEDLFESLVGAIYWIGNKAVTVGLGFILARNFVLSIFSQVPIDLEVIAGHVKSQIKEIFEKLGWGAAIERWNPEESTFSLRFTREALSSLSNYKFESDILAVGNGPTKKVASNAAYRQAVQNLASLGIDRNVADDVRRRNEVLSPELSPYVDAVVARFRSQGYEGAYFDSPIVVGDMTTVRLLGVRPDQTRDVIAQLTRPGRDTNALKKELFISYANGQ